MPTYEYECTQGCNFEVQQSITEDAYTTCRKAFCPKRRGGVRVRRLISASRFILKGSGWYSDGYSSSGGGGAASGTSSSAGSTTSAAGDSKPASSSGSDSSKGGASSSSTSGASTQS